jgi:hypothetical protein
MSIDSTAVEAAFLDCLFRDEEITDGVPNIAPVVVEGIVSKFGFEPTRLESHRAEVSAWLSMLPAEFLKGVGGGWSFLNACNDRDGEQWTGFHQRVEQLFALGIGLGLASWQLPREMWEVLPGGMPYVVVDVPEAQS